MPISEAIVSNQVTEQSSSTARAVNFSAILRSQSGKRKRTESVSRSTPNFPRPTYGTKDDITSLKSADSWKSIYVSMLHPTTTEDQLIDYVLGLNLKPNLNSSDLLCRKLLASNRRIEELRFLSFKISVPDDIFDMLIDPAMWPKTVAVREFVNRSRQTPMGAFLYPQTPETPVPPTLNAQEEMN